MGVLRRILRVVAMILAGPMLLIGVIWILQGINILPGSFMTGHIQWAIYGVGLVIAGGALVWWLKPWRN